MSSILSSSWCSSAWDFPKVPFRIQVEGPGTGVLPPAVLSATPPLPQTSLRQMSQTRFYVAESRAVVPRVSLFVGGLPPGLSPQEYGNLLEEAVATKGVTTCAGLGLLAAGYQGGAGVLRAGCGAAGRGRVLLPLPTMVTAFVQLVPHPLGLSSPLGPRLGHHL